MSKLFNFALDFIWQATLVIGYVLLFFVASMTAAYLFDSLKVLL